MRATSKPWAAESARRVVAAITAIAFLTSHVAFAHAHTSDTPEPEAPPGTPGEAPASEHPESPAPARSEPRASSETVRAAPADALSGADGAPSAATLTPQAISTPKGQGTVDGLGESFSVEPSTGVLSLAVPLSFPRARGTAQPSVSLGYSSAAGGGNAGLGWSLSVPFIARQTDKGVPRYADAAPGQFDPNEDRYVFGGGQELVPICIVSRSQCAALPDEVMPTWATGWRYFRARVEHAFMRFFLSPNRRTWRVQDKTGVQMELGEPLDGSGDEGALERDPDSPLHVYRWNLARAYDPQGSGSPLADAAPRPTNVVVYRYAQDRGTAYLTDVFDTPPLAEGSSSQQTAFAHHVRVVYESRPDESTSYRRGYASILGRRVTRIDVTSATGSDGPRALVRRYHLEYDPAWHASRLASVTLEGRCATPVVEDAAGTLPATTGCARMPATSFRYSDVRDVVSAAVPFADIGVFNHEVTHSASSPERSVGPLTGEFLDIDGDALPDVLRTAVDSTGFQRAYMNGQGGKAAAFSARVPVTLPSDGVLASNDINFANPFIRALDVDGDARIELGVFPGFTTTSRVYSLEPSGAGLRWKWRPLVRPTDPDAVLDLTQDGANVGVADVNGDGLVDIVRTNSRTHTYLSLGRYPGGAGHFGTAVRTGPESASLSMKPIVACTSAQLEDHDVRLGDMNGDGLPDLVYRGTRYWPGRGDGHFGIGAFDACGTDTGVRFQTPTQVVQDSMTAFGLVDVNGDGLDDYVTVANHAVDIYFNIDGRTFSAPLDFVASGIGPSFSSEIRFTDINGSGTTDIVWGTDNRYSYLDLLGGTRPGLLTAVSNGLGRTVTFEHAPSTSFMLEAAAGGKSWASKMPIVTHAVKRVTVSSGLAVAGRPAPSMVTEYTYRDPVFDGQQREFRGFREVTAHVVGDAGADPTATPGSSTRTTFLTGDCVDETPADGVDDCAPDGHWRDNKREALKGQPTLVEVFDDAGTYLATKHTTYTLRHLATGLDGRSVRFAFASAGDTWRYDTHPFTPLVDGAVVPEVVLDGVPGSPVPATVPLRASAGRVHTQTTSTVDQYGNSLRDASLGCVEGCAAKDEAIAHVNVPTRLANDGSGWLFRTTSAWIEGSSTPARHRIVTEYDARGNLTIARAELAGSLALDRFHQDALAPIASDPPLASRDGVIPVLGRGYDTAGNIVFERGPQNRCRGVAYDQTFGLLPVSEALYAGAVGPDVGAAVAPTASAAFASSAAGAGCGSRALSTTAEYDAGLQLVTQATSIDGAVTKAEYDGLGRIVRLWRPDPAHFAGVAALPSLVVAYDIDETGKRPYSLIHTQTEDGASSGDGSYRDGWAYVDGLGRTVVTLGQADPTAGDAKPWVATGLTDFDAKGAPRRVFRPWFTDGPPNAYPLDAAPPSLFETHVYDGFGRERQHLDLVGDVALETHFHALSEDVWDAADLRSTEHAGTFGTTTKDGHGRVVATTERFRENGTLVAADVRTAYLASGEPAVITRVRSGATPIVRWMRYDSLGRLVLNVEPNTSVGFNADPTTPATALKAWRYAYDDAGEIVGTSDARGCGVNAYYDAAGRPVADDYSPCTREQGAYTPPNLTTGDGTEVFRRYDAPDPSAPADFVRDGVAMAALVGRVASLSDRGAQLFMRYDGRGRLTASAKRVARPDEPVSSLANRYALEAFERSATFDAADRPVTQTTGAQVAALLGTDGTSSVTTSYTKRGTVREVHSSYGGLVTGVIHDADGLVNDIAYADLAGTHTAVHYDAKRRVESVTTFRGQPQAWASHTPTYTPGSEAETLQLLLQDDQVTYDEVDNPVAIVDHRMPHEWPAGAEPVSRTLKYDDLYRLTSAVFTYPNVQSTWISPFDAEDHGRHSDTRRARPNPHIAFDGRVKSLSFAYDWLGNTVASTDDVAGFYDRSLGQIANGGAGAGPYQLTGASNRNVADAPSGRRGDLTARYDAAGELIEMTVMRDGPCEPTGASCAQRFAYAWDEVGQLARARRWDGAVSDGAASPVADLHYSYDANGARVRKTATDGHEEHHALYVFESLEIRGATWDGGRYSRTELTEVPRLGAHGVTLARVHYATEDVPSLAGGRLRVLLAMPDLLGSTSIVVDRETGELVERTTYAPYGAVESDYRPERWHSFREDYGFTGKEADVEVGVQYFGARYFVPALGRWMSPDPLAIHGLGADLNVYAYVHGHVLKATDPIGLDDGDGSGGSGGGGGGGGGAATYTPPIVASQPPTGFEDATFWVGAPGGGNEPLQHFSSFDDLYAKAQSTPGSIIFYNANDTRAQAQAYALEITGGPTQIGPNPWADPKAGLDSSGRGIFDGGGGGSRTALDEAVLIAATVSDPLGTAFNMSDTSEGKSGGVPEGRCASCEGSSNIQALSLAWRFAPVVTAMAAVVEHAFESAASRAFSTIAAEGALVRGAENIRTFESLVDARAAATRMAGLGEDTVKYVSEVGPMRGQVVGSASADGLRGWRIDFDPSKGFHVNWWDKSAGAARSTWTYGANIINGGTEGDFLNFLQHLQ